MFFLSVPLAEISKKIPALNLSRMLKAPEFYYFTSTVYFEALLSCLNIILAPRS